MRASAESVRVRWLVVLLAWAGACALLTIHERIVVEYLTAIGKFGLRGQKEATTPLKAAYPAFAVDAETWVRHALSLVEGDQIRLRHTMDDNAPIGREVHWNSAWAWAIVGAGEIERAFTGQPLPEAIENGTRWLPPATMLVLMLIMAAWAARRAGAIAGVFLVMAIVGHPRVYEGFYPSYVDHHGLLTLAAMGVAVGAVFMGGGWWRPADPGQIRLLPASTNEARSAAVFSALAGACGMWVSAASAIPPIAFTGLAGLATILMQKREGWGQDTHFDPDVWRTWGRAGAIASFVFYLVEYFPNHLGLRLEPNHPFYSLAWLGGSELIAQAGEYWFRLDTKPKHTRWRLIGALAGVAVAPLTILIGGAAVFGVMDPFMVNLHKNIQEFLPLWMSIKAAGWSRFFDIVGPENLGLLVGLGVLAVQGRRSPPVLVLAVGMVLGCTALGWYQARWMLNASGAQIMMAWVLVVYFTQSRGIALRWIAALAVAGTLFLPQAFIRISEARTTMRSRQVGPKDAEEMLFRDIAATIRATSPGEKVVLLSSPNSSAGIGYYGRLGTVGTLYWENADGLMKSAQLHSVENADQAKEMMIRDGVTHIALLSDENFIEPFYRLLHPDAPREDAKKALGYQLLVNRSIPQWLQMIPYKAPDDLLSLNITVYLFKVVPDQTPATAIYHIALGKLALGLTADAEKDFDYLIQNAPDAPQPWLRKSEMLFARREWAAGTDALIAGIQRSPQPERMALFANAAGSLFGERRIGEAMQMYRAALAEQFDPRLAADLAFLLSSVRQDSLRDGKLAEELARKALATDPNSPAFLNSLAAAQAENGRFEDAAVTATQAAASARQRGDAATVTVSEQRVALFRRGQPVRN